MFSHSQLMQIISRTKPTHTNQESKALAEQEFIHLANCRCDDILSPYVNNRTKVKMRNRLTGKEFEVTPDSYKRRQDTLRVR